MKLSIILPVYNVERYIEKCLISLLGKQDFEQTDYEVIIINDGSTDDVLSIIQRYTIQYSNIRIYNQKNQGQSAARNYGLKVAQGEYIWFVDPDDWIEDNVLKTLYQEVSEQQLDCLWFKWQRINDENRRFVDNFDNIGIKKDSPVVSGEVFLNNYFGCACYSVAFWFKRDYLLKHSFFYTCGRIFEDVELIPRILYAAKRVKFKALVVYNYYVRLGSSINSVSLKKYEDLKWIIHKINHQSVRGGCLYFDRLLSSLVVLGMKLVASSNYKMQRNDFKQYLQIEQIYHLLYFDSSMVHESIVCVYNFLNVKTIDLLVQIRRILRK